MALHGTPAVPAGMEDDVEADELRAYAPDEGLMMSS
eukprot:CAMPEP_0119286068 /NCGR_PEP_ID=MMETSP1329-20130426/33279_1 /TAXON_ID=114041 /ORGANISM="Genus nov. species nov., Strain RCC1024" /LENGTH=35 /DNA_ID= /DNA_START= /DNA_END= /DNA_ORIENTATION=